jgi:hypothetical protein
MRDITFYWLRKVALLVMLVAGVVACGTESSRSGSSLPIKGVIDLPQKAVQISMIPGAPAWAVEGSRLLNANENRQFYGVGSAIVMGDMALQKATADDQARAEVGRIFLMFIQGISHDYLSVANAESISINEGLVLAQIEGASKSAMANTRIAGSWRDVKSKTIWVGAVLDLKLVKSQIAGFSEMDERFKTYFEASADAAFDRMSK